MPRGQYDRAAARLRKSLPTQQAYNEMMSEQARNRMGEVWDGIAQSAQELVSDNSVLVDTLLAQHIAEGQVVDLKRQLAEALEKVDKLQRLCNTHGLWVE